MNILLTLLYPSFDNFVTKKQDELFWMEVTF